MQNRRKMEVEMKWEIMCSPEVHVHGCVLPFPGMKTKEN